METSYPKHTSVLRIARWFAVGIGVAFVILVVVLNIAGAPPPGESAPTTIWDVLKLIAMIITFAGVGLCWKWPLIGGIVILGGYGSFEGLMYAEQQRFAGGLFLIFPALAVVHIVIHLIRLKQRVPS